MGVFHIRSLSACSSKSSTYLESYDEILDDSLLVLRICIENNGYLLTDFNLSFFEAISEVVVLCHTQYLDYSHRSLVFLGVGSLIWKIIEFG